ncbi:MAG TPA: phosphotransferase [Bryobacteraceae bacterium]|nr:phosphotransferase [Bryobacteraceae bacterium]
MIPPESLAPVTRAINDAFGVAAFDDIRDLTERPGSNRAFRIVVRGSAYLLRINTRAGDMTRHYTAMQAAADAGLAPRVHYASPEDRVSITDFVEAVPFPATDALRRVPAALRTLHALAPFPAAPFNTTCTFLLNKGAALDGFLHKFRAANILPERDLNELFTQYARVAEAYSSIEPDPAPSHNDLFKPDNILFDGTRLWLVDWEAAFQNDRYADLAVAANMLVSNEAEERIYLHEYFGTAPDSYQSARFHLMRQLAHIFYAMVFLSLGSAAKPIDWSEPVPASADFQRRFWAREAGLADDHSKALYGRVHWEQLRGNPEIEEALRAVAKRKANLAGYCAVSEIACLSRSDATAPRTAGFIPRGASAPPIEPRRRG